MSVSTLIGRSFGAADYGVAWAMFQLPGRAVRDDKFWTGDLQVQVLPFKDAKGGDDYAIIFNGVHRPKIGTGIEAQGSTNFSKGLVKVLANSAVGTISGLLRLGDMVKSGQRKNLVQNLQFRTRNYKHEVKFDSSGPHCIQQYTDQTWEQLCQHLVQNQFNGLVLYTGYHPFEHMLDYSDFPEAASKPSAYRIAVRGAVNRGLAMAHRYGLTTFMQHYVGHFTEALQKHYNIPITSRLAAVDHPEVNRYCRWCYEQAFEQLPDLDGLYFNFESYPDCRDHLLTTAVPVFNRRKIKPIMMLRLWNFRYPENYKKIRKAYKGRMIVSHKVADTNDTYYLPKADSRAKEWKKAIGKDLEFMFEIGPCHNCGTNLCMTMWGDYDFAYDLIADAKKQGADSFSFHSVHELFSSQLPEGGWFGAHERNLSRFNFLHAQAIIDFVNNRRRTPAEQAEVLGRLSNLPLKARLPMRNAIVAASMPVILMYQQFCMTSAMDGYINPGRYSLVQDPFMYYHATVMNDQATSPLWKPDRMSPWLKKTMNAKVAPDNFLQYVIDYVDPSKKRATRNPAKIVELLDKSIIEARKAVSAMQKAGAKEIADTLGVYIEQNAAIAKYTRQQILAAIELYGIFFAKSKPAVVKALRKAVVLLGEAQDITGTDPGGTIYKLINRVTMLDRLDQSPLIEACKQTLDLLNKGAFNFKAYQAYLDSRRQYNEIRRYVRPNRLHTQQSLLWAAKCLKASLAAGQKCLAMLKGAKDTAPAENVGAWVDFVQNELDRLAIPVLKIGQQPAGDYQPLRHDDCFHFGENVVEDFSGFFQTRDYHYSAKMGFRAWYTSEGLSIEFAEHDVDMALRKANWNKYRQNSAGFVQRLHLDTGSKGKTSDTFLHGVRRPKVDTGSEAQVSTYIVWPGGAGVSRNNAPYVPAKVEYTERPDGWTSVTLLPWSVIGRTPKKGDRWGLNITANTEIIRYHCYTWSTQYDSVNPQRFGVLQFT